MSCEGRMRAERSWRRRSARYGDRFGDVPAVVDPCKCDVGLEEI